MPKLLSCSFNIDTDCVELKFIDRSIIAIYCTSVENSIDTTIYSRAEMHWLIYNDPLSYAQLVFDGTLEDYLKQVSGKRIWKKAEEGFKCLLYVLFAWMIYQTRNTTIVLF